MDLRVFTEPQQGASYDDLLAVAQMTEECGYDAFFRSDHYLKMGAVSGVPGPTDAWVTLAGLARETDAHPARHPAHRRPPSGCPGPSPSPSPRSTHMSGGRVELGLGAGWYEQEHRAYGIPFPPWASASSGWRSSSRSSPASGRRPAGETFSFSGRHYR